MSTNYQWQIVQLDTKPREGELLDVVICVHWVRTAQDGDINVSSYGTMGCETPSATDFTAYPDLTQAQVESWLDAGLQVEEIDLGLQSQIDNIITPKIVVLPLPWDSNLAIPSN